MKKKRTVKFNSFGDISDSETKISRISMEIYASINDLFTSVSDSVESLGMNN